MAVVSTPNLVVVEKLDNREVNVTYQIDYDFFDNATNLRYKHVVELIGDDSNVTLTPLLPQEIVRESNLYLESIT